MKNREETKQLIEELFKTKERLKFPLEELARMFSVNRKTLYRWKNNESVPNRVYLPMIKKFIELSKKKKYL